jgi:hypothetical protein
MPEPEVGATFAFKADVEPERMQALLNKNELKHDKLDDHGHEVWLIGYTDRDHIGTYVPETKTLFTSDREAFRECLTESKPPYANPNFDEEKYGKYFTQDAEGNYKLIPEKADEYFDLLVKLWKEQDDKEVNEAFFINPTSLDGYERGCVIKDDDGEYKFVTSHDEAHPVALFDTKEAAEEVAKKLADQHTASKFPVVAESLLHEANLTEKKWEVRLESGKALRQAIDGEDGEEIKEALKNCYKEINRKMPEEFDEDELESMLDDLDMADFSENEEVGVDAEEAEDNVNAYLGDFYDFCDGYNIWVEI